MSQGAPEWPPAPARVFQALLAGVARGSAVPEGIAPALEWLESLRPPVIAAPRARAGGRISLFVPNNDADAVSNPRDVSGIRTKKVVHPILFEEDVPLLYAWSLEGDTPHETVVIKAANDLYQLGRGVDMAWALAELVDDEALEGRFHGYNGTVHRPEPDAPGRALACPTPGALASLMERHRSARLQRPAQGGLAQVLFTNAPKPRFKSVTYTQARTRTVFELRSREDDAKASPWPLRRVVRLVEALRDGAASRLREALPDAHSAIERTLIGRKADGRDPSPIEHRARILPLPSIGHEHADRAVRRIVLEVPSSAGVAPSDVEWAFSGLETVDPETGVVGPFLLTRAESDNMLSHYEGPSRRWRSVTAVALPETASRRRIDPHRRGEEAKSAGERAAEEDRAVAAVHIALRRAGVRGMATAVRLQREPFEARGARAESFAEGTRFAKERLWHVELELDRSIRGPLVIGDGRFLGLGLMAPLTLPTRDSGIFCLGVEGSPKNDPVALCRALRRAVMAAVQEVIGDAPLGVYFSGHDEHGAPARADRSGHLAFQWDPARQRLLVIAPHRLDRREPAWDERRAMDALDEALDGVVDLRAGWAGRFALRRCPISADDPIVAAARSWISVTPYTVTRHVRHGSALEALVQDVRVDCGRRGLPAPEVTVLESHGVPGRGLQGRVRLDFAVAVTGPLALGRTRYLGGGLFQPTT
jgi:CRISPR-associated protein Csb2